MNRSLRPKAQEDVGLEDLDGRVVVCLQVQRIGYLLFDQLEARKYSAHVGQELVWELEAVEKLLLGHDLLQRLAVGIEA